MAHNERETLGLQAILNISELTSLVSHLYSISRIVCAQHKDNTMHFYRQPDKSELPPTVDLEPRPARHIYLLNTQYDTAWMNPLPEFSLLLIWRGHFNSTLLCIFWLSCLSSLADITSALWIGTLLALDMVNWTFYGLWKGVFFIFHFYSWALNLAVNASKKDSALLDSWIKSMLPIMAVVGGHWGKTCLCVRLVSVSPTHT